MRKSPICAAHRTADIALAGIFAHAGYRVATSPDGPAEQVRTFAQRYMRTQPPRAIVLVRLNAAIMIAASASLALGRMRRTAAAALALVLQPTNLVGHPFWEHSGDHKIKETNAFMSNVAIAGGLMYVALDADSPNRRRSWTRAMTKTMR